MGGVETTLGTEDVLNQLSEAENIAKHVMRKLDGENKGDDEKEQEGRDSNKGQDSENEKEIGNQMECGGRVTRSKSLGIKRSHGRKTEV